MLIKWVGVGMLSRVEVMDNALAVAAAKKRPVVCKSGLGRVVLIFFGLPRCADDVGMTTSGTTVGDAKEDDEAISKADSAGEDAGAVAMPNTASLLETAAAVDTTAAGIEDEKAGSAVAVVRAATTGAGVERGATTAADDSTAGTDNESECVAPSVTTAFKCDAIVCVAGAAASVVASKSPVDDASAPPSSPSTGASVGSGPRVSVAVAPTSPSAPGSPWRFHGCQNADIMVGNATGGAKARARSRRLGPSKMNCPRSINGSLRY